APLRIRIDDQHGARARGSMRCAVEPVGAAGGHGVAPLECTFRTGSTGAAPTGRRTHAACQTRHFVRTPDTLHRRGAWNLTSRTLADTRRGSPISGVRGVPRGGAVR